MKPCINIFGVKIIIVMILFSSCTSKEHDARAKLDPWIIQNGLIYPPKVEYFRKEALAGNKVASDCLYRHYRRSGDPQAIEWLRLSVAQGYVTAMMGLSAHLRMYQSSSEPAQKEADIWILISRRMGNSLANELTMPSIGSNEDVLPLKKCRLIRSCY